MKTYWIFQDDMAVINRVIWIGGYVVIPKTLQRWVLEQHHVNHIGIKKLQTCKPIY